MSEINTDWYQVQLDTVNIQNNERNKEIVIHKSETQRHDVSEISPATKTEISKQALSDINNIMSKEDVIVNNLNKSNGIYETLTNVRNSLSELIYELKNTNKYDNIEILEELDKKSNNIIIDLEKLLKKEEKNGLVDFNYTNIFINGLSSIRKLNISDENYLANLEKIANLVINKEIAYKNSIDKNLKDSSKINEDYNTLALATENSEEKSVNNLQQEIITKANETLNSVTKGLTPETVLRLLNP